MTLILPLFHHNNINGFNPNKKHTIWIWRRSK